MIDFTSLRVFTQRFGPHLVPLVCGIILFVAGWQFGRVTSPYYAVSPIVFQDRTCAACSASGGSKAELQALQEEGDVLGVKTTPTPRTAPAAKISTAPLATTTQGQFVASKNSNLYHYFTCPSAKRIKPANQRWFATAAAAKAAGLNPSKCTLQKVGS